MEILLNIILVVVAAVFAFRVHWALGIIFLVVIGILLWKSKYSEFMAGRGNAEFNKGNIDLALSYYEKAISKKNAKYSTVVSYANVLLRTGKAKEALEHVNRVLGVSNLVKETKKLAKQTRVLINYKLGEYGEAYDEAIELFEEGYTTSNMYCLVGLMMIVCKKPPEETLKFCEKAYDYDSDSRDIVDNYLLSLINCAEYEKAKEISEELIELAPEFVEAYYHSALLYKKLGDNNKAKEFLSHIPECNRTYMTTVSEKEIEDLQNSL